MGPAPSLVDDVFEKVVRATMKYTHGWNHDTSQSHSILYGIRAFMVQEGVFDSIKEAIPNEEAPEKGKDNA